MRIAFCVGCNSYDVLPPLNGAEEDARRMFDALTDERLGSYHPTKSQLLLSPTLSEVRSTIEEILYSGDQIDDFTFFFAGHGGVVYDALYLAFRDADNRKMAISAFSFSELARITVAARPVQANFVLDACNSGGLGLDLPAILKQSLMGNAESTGVSALAAAAADEYAAEMPEGGAFTTELLRVIRGDIFVQQHKEFLDLPEIGAILRPSAHPGHHQTVSTWVLNLQGSNRFSKNPHYSATGGADPVVALLGKRLALAPADVVAIKRISLQVQEEVDEVSLASSLERLIGKLDPNDAATLLAGLAEGISEQVRGSSDPFAEGRVLSVFLGQFLNLTRSSVVADHYLKAVLERLKVADLAALHRVGSEIEAHKFKLITSRDALADFYFLPLRIADVFGRIGVLLLSDELHHSEVSFLESLTKTLLNVYGNSVLSTCDEQAAPFAVFLAACHKRGWIDIAEEVTGRLYNDLVANFGRVARHFLTGEQALNVLDERYNHSVASNGELYQSPSDLATVILMAAALLHLDEAIDQSMILIDHTPLNFLIPRDVRETGTIGPIPGKNFGLSVGHGIWRCIDLRREWNATINPLLNSSANDCGSLHQLSGGLASLALRDRVPWSLLATIFVSDTNETFTTVSFT